MLEPSGPQSRTNVCGDCYIAFVELLRAVPGMKALTLEPLDTVECFNQPFDCYITRLPPIRYSEEAPPP